MHTLAGWLYQSIIRSLTPGEVDCPLANGIEKEKNKIASDAILSRQGINSSSFHAIRKVSVLSPKNKIAASS
jgi:hypothetical protein